jgi:FG-GAP-like repeat/FG-GAP repeat
LADVNGDGKLDVVAADESGLDVLLANSAGALGSVKTFASGGGLSSVAIADFNSDGKPDVAAANPSSGGIALFLGNGDGTFHSAQTILLAGGSVPRSAVSGDFNGDGKPDLIVAFSPSDNTQPGGIAVLLGKGDGTFQTPVNITLPGPIIQQIVGSASSAALAVGDFNGDGKLDIATAINGADSNQVAVLLGNGDGTFRIPLLTDTNTSPPMMVVTDQNDDGIPDLLLADCCGLSEASLLLGNGDGTFQLEVQFPSGPNPRAIASADFSGDGHLDAAVIGQVQQPDRGTLVILFNPGPQATVFSAANPTGIIAPGSLATVYGSDLAKGTPGGTSAPLPTSFGGSSITIVDSAGKSWAAPLIYVSKGQVNFYVPTGVATGTAQLTVTSGDGTKTIGSVQVASVAPGIFTLNSVNLAAAFVVLYHTDGTQNRRAGLHGERIKRICSSTAPGYKRPEPAMSKSPLAGRRFRCSTRASRLSRARTR